MQLRISLEAGTILGAALVVRVALPCTALAANVAIANATVTTIAPPAAPQTVSQGQSNTTSAAASLGSEAADANVFVDFGILRAAAFVSRGAGSASASTLGVWEDSLTLNSFGFDRQRAEMTISIAVDVRAVSSFDGLIFTIGDGPSAIVTAAPTLRSIPRLSARRIVER